MREPMTPLFTIQQMTLPDVQLALDWAAKEGWNPGLNDASAFYAADPTGFLKVEVDGEPIGCISAVCYDATFGFIGLYIVKPEWRGRGYGLQLWQTAWQQLTTRLDGVQPSIGLDGVVERETTYCQAGFVCAYRHIRHVYQPASSDGIPSGVFPLATLPFEAVVHYDATLFPARRTRFLEAWLRINSGAAYGVVEQDHLVGYGVLRPCRQGFKIGPLFADNPDIAECLLQALTHHAFSQPTFIDIPVINPAIHFLSRRYTMQSVFTCARMYYGNLPNIDIERIFGVTTLELG